MRKYFPKTIQTDDILSQWRIVLTGYSRKAFLRRGTGVALENHPAVKYM
jgi:hypothetical protein